MRITAIFNTTRDVIEAEGICVIGGIKVAVVPTPKKYSKNCGMSLSFESQFEEVFLELMQKHNIDVTTEREE